MVEVVGAKTEAAQEVDEQNTEQQQAEKVNQFVFRPSPGADS